MAETLNSRGNYQRHLFFGQRVDPYAVSECDLENRTGESEEEKVIQLNKYSC